MGIETVTHADMNFRRDMHRATGAGLRWSRINAGSRSQVELPVTNTRHFRVASASVKSGEAATTVVRPIRAGSFSFQTKAPSRPIIVPSLVALPSFS